MKGQKRILALAMTAGLAVSATARAQFSVVNNLPGSFVAGVDVPANLVPGSQGDDVAAAITIPAAYGNLILPGGAWHVDSNGKLGNFTFSTFTNASLTNTSAAGYYPHWDDFLTNVSSTSGVYAQDTGTAFIVQWNATPYNTAASGVPASGDAKIQLQIFPTGSTPAAQFVYQGLGTMTGQSATIGFVAQAGPTAAQYSYNIAGSISDTTVLSLITNAATGACCMPDGSCQVNTSGGCGAISGAIYRGDNSACATANCPIGACCLGNGTCVSSATAGCATLSGVYRGDGTACATANCPSGACCIAVGCVITAGPGCTAQGGTYAGDGSTCAQAGCPQAWTEQGDAGSLPATAQVVAGSGPLPGIVGNTTAGDVDMYQIQICDAANFSANTGDGTATAFADTQLFLFDSTGRGVAVDDDDPQGTLGLHSRLSGQFVPGNGLYYLAVTGYNQDPHTMNPADPNNLDLIWANTPFNVERRPDGPTPGDPVASWDVGSTYTGAYTIFLTGSCYVGQQSHCYANCDGSTAVPFLNISDFVCFQSAFAAGSSYANCDGSTAAPILNISDFVCFQSAFAAGCSAP